MKKNRNISLTIKMILLMLLVLPMLVYNRNFLNASEIADWEFLPLGENYLSDDNFSYLEGNKLNIGTISTINYIRVKENTKK